MFKASISGIRRLDFLINLLTSIHRKLAIFNFELKIIFMFENDLHAFFKKTYSLPTIKIYLLIFFFKSINFIF